MRASLICWLICATACSHQSQSSPPQAASSPVVDVMREVVLIPDDGNCKPFDGWFAMSEPAVRQLRYNQIQHQKQADLAVLLCNTARQGAEAVAREMTVERDNAIWWQRYAPVLIGLAAVLAGSAGAVLGFELGRK